MMERLTPAQRFRVRELAQVHGFQEADWLLARAQARVALLQWIDSQKGSNLRRVDLARAAASAAGSLLLECDLREGPLGTGWKP